MPGNAGNPKARKSAPDCLRALFELFLMQDRANRCPARSSCECMATALRNRRPFDESDLYVTRYGSLRQISLTAHKSSTSVGVFAREQQIIMVFPAALSASFKTRSR